MPLITSDILNYIQLPAIDLPLSYKDLPEVAKDLQDVAKDLQDVAKDLQDVAKDLQDVAKNIPLLTINKNEYNKKFEEFNFTNIYNEFVIKKTNINLELYNLLMYIFYDKYILNYNCNNIFIYYRTQPKNVYYHMQHSLSHIYLSDHWNFIENKLVEENIFDTIEYKQLYDYCNLMFLKYKNLKTYLIGNNIELPYTNIPNNLNLHYANCVYTQFITNANIAFIYAYLPKVNFGLNI